METGSNPPVSRNGRSKLKTVAPIVAGVATVIAALITGGFKVWEIRQQARRASDGTEAVFRTYGDRLARIEGVLDVLRESINAHHPVTSKETAGEPAHEHDTGSDEEHAGHAPRAKPRTAAKAPREPAREPARESLREPPPRAAPPKVVFDRPTDTLSGLIEKAIAKRKAAAPSSIDDLIGK